MRFCFSFIVVLLVLVVTDVAAQTSQVPPQLHSDHLSLSFHAGRRQALRDHMAANSVAVIFSYAEKVFSKDVNFVYHPNPDLYYFSGYREPNAVLLIFKEMQTDHDGSFNELFFVQHRDTAAEQWTGRRLGVEGVEASLGFQRVYNGEDFAAFPIDLKKFNLVYDDLPDTSSEEEAGGMKSLVGSFVRKAGIVEKGAGDATLLNIIYQYASPRNIQYIFTRFASEMSAATAQNDTLIALVRTHPDSAGIAQFRKAFEIIHSGPIAFNSITGALRGVKTPEELDALKKAVYISGIAHAEVMKAVGPTTSESEIEGIMRYVHKKYGAEDEGYPPIVGAGANGCILHYEENAAAHIDNQMVVMDVGAMYQGYSADVTRSFPGSGKFSEAQKAIYQLVYDAQEQVFPLCRAGIPFDSLQRKTTQVLAAGLMKLGLISKVEDVRLYYPHGVSHHLGLDVHDKGELGPLKENMVITVEPGIYIPAGSPCDKKWWNIGVRIEDDVVIGSTGCTLLSAAAPRKWQDVEKKMAEKSFFNAVALPPLP